jgi:hypothetical protein
MLADEFMEGLLDMIADRFDTVIDGFEEAKADISSVQLPEGVRPMRLSLHEVSNILRAHVQSEGMFDGTLEIEGGLGIVENVEAGFARFSEQIYLNQFPEKIADVTSCFRADLVQICRHNPHLIPAVSPLIGAFKKSESNQLAINAKYVRVRDLALGLFPALEDEEDYAYRLVLEMHDFASLVVGPGMEVPVPANDNALTAG